MTHPMTQDQWHLFTHGKGSWRLLDFIIDFEMARTSEVAGQSGGTFYFRDGARGWHQTTAKGYSADLELVNYHLTDPRKSLVFVPWSLVKTWARSQPNEIFDAAKALRLEMREHYKSHPPMYASIGHAYAWDRRPRGTEEECEADREELAAVQAQLKVESGCWREAKAEIDERMDALCATLPAPTLLDDLVLQQRSA